MPKLNRQAIQSLAKEVLAGAVGGIRWTELLKRVEEQNSETPHNSIHGAIHQLLTSDPEIIKVARGTYQLKTYYDAQSKEAQSAGDPSGGVAIEVENPAHEKVTLLESEFYESFATWLVDVAEEVNDAFSLGGNILKGKWGTPDVIGVLKPRANDILKFEPLIVTAEIKIDASQPVVAFGQAVAYRLFSHRSYIVVPNTTTEEDQSRLKALCTLHGVGLVTFTLDKQAPDYTAVVQPVQANPDMFYANQMLRRLAESAPRIFHKLF